MLQGVGLKGLCLFCLFLQKPIAMKRFLLLFACAVLCISCGVLRNMKSGYAHTEWTGVYKIFVADAGTETVTVTLSFGATKYTMVEKSVMPSYPAPVVKPDGTIDTLPGFSRENTRQGTYKVKGDEIILHQSDGTVHTLRPVSGRLESDDLSFQKIVFEKKGA